MSSSELPEYAVRNRASWTESNEEYTHEQGVRAWKQDEITWGVFSVPESELNALPDVDGKDVIELGCGTAYFSAWLARRGARPVGVDVTPAQLETARQMQRETGIEFPLLEANAEEVPLPDASFDVVLSEYGASIWCDPYKWIPEAARLLRPGGELVFLRNSTLVDALRERSTARPRRCSARSAACTGSTGRTTARRSSSSATQTCSSSCARAASTCST